MDIFEYDDYKCFVAEACAAADLAYARVAEAASIHRQYLTQVLRYKAHLSDEQAYLVGEFLGLRQEALAYFLLLVQEAKTVSPGTRRYFAGRREAMRVARAKLSANLLKETKILATRRDTDYDEFFLDLNLQICHAHLFIPAFQREPRLLRDKLRATQGEFDALLGKLVEMGLVDPGGGQLRSRVPFMHLEKDSALSKQNHRNWRIYAAHMPFGKRDQDLFFSSTVTTERRHRKALIDGLKSAIAEFHKGLDGTADEEAFQVNIDVFGL